MNKFLKFCFCCLWSAFYIRLRPFSCLWDCHAVCVPVWWCARAYEYREFMDPIATSFYRTENKNPAAHTRRQLRIVIDFNAFHCWCHVPSFISSMYNIGRPHPHEATLLYVCVCVCINMGWHRSSWPEWDAPQQRLHAFTLSDTHITHATGQMHLLWRTCVRVHVCGVAGGPKWLLYYVAPLLSANHSIHLGELIARIYCV